MTHDRLTLAEDMLLLGWEDERGWNRYTDNLAMLLGGAAILELVLDERLELIDGRLEVTGTDTGHPALDLVLGRIRESRKPRKTKTWVQRLGNRPKLKRAVLQRLTDRGILREERRRILGLIPVTRYPVVDRQRVAETRERVTATLTLPEPVDDARDAALASLVRPGGGRLLRRLVPKEQRRAARKRAKALSKGEAMSADIAQAIGESNAATMAAIGAAASSSSSSSPGS